jgi:hypothetical protein
MARIWAEPNDQCRLTDPLTIEIDKFSNFDESLVSKENWKLYVCFLRFSKKPLKIFAVYR